MEQPTSPPLCSQSQTKLVYRIADDATQEEKERGVRRTECTTEGPKRPTFRAPAFVRFVVWLPLFTLRGRRQHGLLANIPYSHRGSGRGGATAGKGLGKCSRRKTRERPFYWTLLLLYLLCRRPCNARNAILFVFLVIIVRAIN